MIPKKASYTYEKNFNLKVIDLTGEGEAVIATLNVVDKDGDLTLKGAFGEGQTVKMIPAHNWSHVPLGKATIHEVGQEVIAKFKLNLDVEAAREWHAALLFDLKEGESIQEWSYGFTIEESEQSVEGTDTRVRILKKLKVHEISPVIIGAGEGTRTLSIKNEKHGGTLAEHLSETLTAVEQVVERCAEVKALRVDDGRDLSDDRRDQIKQIGKQLVNLNEVAELIIKVLADKSEETPDETDQKQAEQLMAGFTVARLNL